MSDVIATIDVTPITTPRMVSDDRSLLLTSVCTAMCRISLTSPMRKATTYSLRSASMGSRRAARIAG